MRRNLLLVLAWMGVLVGCGGQGTAAPPTPVEIVQNAATRLQTMPGFGFTIDAAGAPAYVDTAGIIAFREATGSYVAPDKSQALVRVAAPGLVTELQVISIGDRQWQTNLLTGSWEVLPPNMGFNPAALFDPNTGLQSILINDLAEITQVESEKLADGPAPSLSLYKLTATAVADNLFTLTGGLIGPNPVDVALWIAPETWEIHRIVVVEPAAEGTPPSVWQVDFREFDQVVTVNPPIE